MGDRPAKGSGKTRILVVEDHSGLSRILRLTLEMDGYAVETAGSKAEALEKLGTQHFDLFLCDLGLPDGSGLEVMQARKGSGPRGVAFSGHGAREDIERSFAAGFSEHLVKPVEPAKLLEIVKRLLGESAPPP